MLSGSIASLKVALMGGLRATFVAPADGVVDVTVGAVLSARGNPTTRSPQANKSGKATRRIVSCGFFI
jgi:hypothetical protein